MILAESPESLAEMRAKGSFLGDVAAAARSQMRSQSGSPRVVTTMRSTSVQSRAGSPRARLPYSHTASRSSPSSRWTLASQRSSERCSSALREVVAREAMPSE
jgi:hypothetical protein